MRLSMREGGREITRSKLAVDKSSLNLTLETKVKQAHVVSEPG